MKPGLTVAQGNDGHRPLVHSVRAHQIGYGRVGETGPQPGAEAGGVGGRHHLGEHGAGVPVGVAVTAFAVAPAGPPRNTSDDHHGYVALGRRTDLHEGMFRGVVPVDAGGRPLAIRHGDVQLEGEATTRESGPYR